MIRHRTADLEASAEGRVDLIASKEGDIQRSVFSQENTLISINGKKAKKSAKVKAGDRIHIEYDEEVFEGLEGEDIPLSILYEDDDILVINKEQGIAVHPGAGCYSGTVANALVGRYGDDFSTSDDDTMPGIVHRLDNDTSGVMIIARTLESQHRLQEQFSAHRTEKHYYAIAKGFFTSQEGIIEKRIERDPWNRKKFRTTDSPVRGKDAKTAYRVLRQMDGYALLDVRIYTGRTHQIRVHMLSIGHPLLGDPIYGSKDSSFPDASLMLHARELRIRHPSTGREMVFEAPIPDRFQRVICALSGSSYPSQQTQEDHD